MLLRHKFYCTALLLALFLGSCSQPPKIEIDNTGYNNIPVSLQNLDTSPLSGKTILLDPGHGGFFRGVVGLNGLSESEANLGVALYLRGLLEWADCKVYLTRTIDRDFLCPADSSLTRDLAARVAMIDSLSPDVFLSLHHNSNASLDRQKNETQTYYPIGRTGADLDLARSIHKQLTRRLGIKPAKILSGNFFVLRNSSVPSVLGEPSMLSNPDVENKLVKSAILELEAQAYFLGLLDYFAGGSPSWTGPQTVTTQIGTSTKMTWDFNDLIPDSQPDFSTLSLTFNNRPVTPTIAIDLSSISYLPPETLAPGKYTLRISATNRLGRSTPDFAATYEVVDLPEKLKIEMVKIDTRPEYLIQWECIGISSMPCLTEEPVILMESIELNSTVQNSGSFITIDLPDLKATLNDQDFQVEISSTTLPSTFNWLTVTPAGISVLSRSTGNTFCNSIAIDSAQWLESAGFLPATTDSTTTLEMIPLVPSTKDLTVVIDPAGGSGNSQGTGPQGTTGAELNLDIANRVANALQKHGATVHILRTGTEMPLAEQKILETNKVDADLFISITRTSSMTLRHHHNSNGGELFATHYSAFAAPLDSIIVTPAYDYLLRQTPCPAVIIGLPSVKDAASEIVLLDSVYSQDQATAIISAVIGFATGSDQVIDTFSPNNIEECNNADQVLVDGYLPWIPGQLCGVPNLQQNHTLEIHKGDQHKLIAFDITVQ